MINVLVSSMRKIVFTTSTFPVSDTDPVPAFIKDEAIWIKKLYPQVNIDILAPHNAYSDTKKFQRHKYYNEYRFHYFWPFTWERLAGRGIQPALKQNKLLYIELPFLFIAEIFCLWRYAKKHKPDLIYAHWFTPQAIAAAIVSKLSNIPFVFDTQASDVIVLKKIPFARQIVGAICDRALAYTAPSRQTCDKLLYFATDKNRQRMKHKLHLIPLGTAPMPAKKSSIKYLRHKYDLKDTKLIFFVGRLVNRKGIHLLIDAFADLAAKDSTLRLVIAGEGQDKAKYKRQAELKGLGDRITFVGFISGETKSAWLQMAEIVVIPSINEGDNSEGLPVAFMEAVSFGKITVVSDVTGAHETVTQSKNGYIFHTGSIEDLTKKLALAIKASNDQNKAMSESIARLAARFHWSSVAKKRAEALRLIK
jgi:glycosyltransferase involved in cell wall biosynthesis